MIKQNYNNNKKAKRFLKKVNILICSQKKTGRQIKLS